MDFDLTSWRPALPSTALPLPEVAFRLLVAGLCSGLLGLDRELREKNLGLRTHMLVSMGAASFTVLVIEMVHALEAPELQMDPTRLIEGIVGGIGFLGAAAIIREGGSVRGATTGAGVWLVGAIGLASGLGLYLHAVLITVFAVAVITLLGLLTYSLRHSDRDTE